MSHGKFIVILFLTKLLSWIVVISVTLLLSLLPAVFIDVRWILLPLIILFFLLPGLSAILYIWHGLKPGCYYNVIPHVVRITCRTLYIENRWEIEEAENIYRSKVRTYCLPLSSLQSPQQIAGGLLWLYKNKQGFVWVPFSAIKDSDSEELNSMIQ